MFRRKTPGSATSDWIGKRSKRIVSIVLVLLLAMVGTVLPSTSAMAAEWGISKQVISDGPYAPGDNVEFVVTISCSDPSGTDQTCDNTEMSDVLPDGLVLVSASVSSGGGEVDADVESNTVTYTNEDGVGTGDQAQIAITAKIDPDLPYSESGKPIENTATVVSDNAEEKSSSATVTPVVDLDLSAEAAKTIDPDGALAVPGTDATMTVEGTNTSNTPVDTMVVQDPVDPSADPNPFTYLEYTGTGDIEMPENATDVTEEYWDGDSWETLDDSVDPADVQGVRYTFSGDIQPGATATIPVEVQQADAVAELTDPTAVNNDTSTVVSLDGEESEPATADDTYLITPPNTSVTASKSFSPAEVEAGKSTTVTLGATNTGTAVDSLIITEPGPGTDSPFEGDDPLTFTGWGSDSSGAGIVWPADATEATVVYTCADGTEVTESTTTVDTMPATPPQTCTIVGFTVEFTGDIVNGAEATIPFTADTDPDQEPDRVSHPNEVQAEVPNTDPATANDELVTLQDRLATDIEKIITPSTIPAAEGQNVVVQLPSSLLPFGEDGSTTEAGTFVVQDPVNTDNPGEFWDNFTATGVRSTSVPANATLTVEYWDGQSWQTAPDCPPTHGPATVNCDLPENAQGVRFTYDADDGEGFPPGTEFQPNFTADYTGPADRDEPIENCAASSAAAETVDPTEPVEGCDTVDPFPTDGSGTVDFLDKTMLGDPATVRARTDDQVTGRITWSTGGFSGVDPMAISDIADPESTDISDSFYDAFNLAQIEAIDSSVDPLVEYDAISGVELYNGSEWVQATNSPCTNSKPCDGGMDAVPLTAEEQSSTISARVIYTESPTRPDTSDDPTAPIKGDGVARSVQDDGRHLDLTFQVRDYKRSNTDEPVLGATRGTMYNTDDAGVVNNTARATATYRDRTYTDSDGDTAEILDEPLNVGVRKDWSGGPLSVPPDGTPHEYYPTTEATITGTNESGSKIDQLRIADPGAEDSSDVITADGTKPFDAFTLREIKAITAPEGTETTTVTLTYDDDSTADFTQDEALALTTSELADVVGVETSFDGLIAPAAAGNMELNLQLRQFDRYTGDPITVDDYSPETNGAIATIDDPGGTDEDKRQAYDDATMDLQDADIALDVTKTFDPDTITEPNHGADADDTPVTMTITGQPQGPSRSVEMVLTDDDPQFWNQYDFVGFDPSAQLAAPIDQVQVDVLTGGTFSGDPDSPDPVTVDGADWIEGTPSDTFTLPDGVNPGDVQGLRFTFTRADGQIWENPATPKQSVPLDVLRRDDMRSGGPVQQDLASNPNAPGETEPGVASNSVDGTTTGADLIVDPDTGEQVPISASDSADAQIRYKHAVNGVSVKKDFDGTVTDGSQGPTSTFPMNITITNTGQRPITDPVITDPMPTDDDGAQLKLADTDTPYSYSLSGSDPDPDTPNLPDNPDEVSVDQEGDIDNLEFTFPDGSVLEVGQSYKVTVMVNFRFGLPPQTPVDNTVGVTGDRPWDDCEPRLDDETGQCQADADVHPSGTAVISQNKLVKATDDDELAVMVDPDYPDQTAECTPNDDGFYAYPCTPVIAPGHNETWQINMENVGNLPMDQAVLYDRLPTPGDVGSYATSSARGSEWSPTLTKDPPPAITDAPDGASSKVYYSTTQDYCMDDIEDPINHPCPTDDPQTGWVELTPDTSPDVYENVTAIKVVITMDPENLLDPGDSVSVEGTTTTPAEAPEAGDRSIAWNSAAAGGVAVTTDGKEVNMLPTEGAKVGVATATGPLTVHKTAAGAGADYAPDEFTLQVQCTSAVDSWLEEDLDPITITVPNGGETEVPNLPYGAECTITEDDSNGQTSLDVGFVTIGESPDAVTLDAVNNYDLGDLELAKTVDSEAVDEDGNPIEYGPFEASVDCSFLGDPVYAEGYGPNDPMVVDLPADGTPSELTGLPINAECTVTETNTGGAAATSMTVNQPGEEPVETDGDTAKMTIVANDEGTAGTQLNVENHFDVGSIHLTKEVTGNGADDYGTGPFVFDVVCTFDADGDGGADAKVVYDDSVSLGGDDPLEATIDDLPVGASCDFTETDNGGATSSEITPNPVTVGADETAEVAATNEFDLGSFSVDKVVENNTGLPDDALGPFEVNADCTYQGADVEIPDGAQRELTPGEPVTYEGLPIGSDCVVTETDDGGATSTTISAQATDGDPGTVTVGPDPAEITVTNVFDPGSVTVDKVIDGEGADFAEGPYEVTLECTFNGTEVDIPGGASRELTPGEPVNYEELPIGAECTTTESEQGQATSVSIDPETVIIGGDDGSQQQVNVSITNSYEVGEFSVQKVVKGDGADFGAGPFEVSTQCSFEGSEIDVPGGATREIEPGGTVTYDGLPVGADCIVTETDDFGATDVEISSSVDGGEPGEVIVPADDAAAAEVTVTNSYDVGTIEVDKKLTGIGSGIYNAGPFEATVDCTFPDGETAIDIPGGATQEFMPGDPAVYEGLPVGAECTVTETDTAGATETTMTVDDGDPIDGTSAKVVVPPNDDGDTTSVEVLATNTFKTSPLVVKKTVDGDGTDFAPDMPDSIDDIDSLADLPYEATLKCTFEGEDVPIPGGETRGFGPGIPAVYLGLPDGAECTIAETDEGGATTTTVVPDSGTISEGTEPIAVEVTNTYDLGEFDVEKLVEGDGAEFAGTDFEVTAECTFEGEDIDMSAEGIGGATRTVSPGEPAVYSGLPVGADCVVTETDTGGATTASVSTTVDGGDPGQVKVPPADDDSATVTVTNTFDVGSIEVDKVVDGDADDVGPFEVSLDCTFNGEALKIPGGAVRDINPNDPVVYDGLPIGAECTVTETDDGGAESTTISTIGEGEPGEVTIGGDPSTITVTNTFADDDNTADDSSDGGGTDGSADSGGSDDSNADGGGADGDADGGGGDLPRTGAVIVTWLIVGLLLIAAGASIIRTVRRRE